MYKCVLLYNQCASGGPGADRSDHFAHCDLFTNDSENEDKEITQVETVKNVPHGAGGCIAPVKIIQDVNVVAIVVSGLGARPMQGFSEVGITVYYADNKQEYTVGTILRQILNTGLPEIHADQICKGSGNCHH